MLAVAAVAGVIASLGTWKEIVRYDQELSLILRGALVGFVAGTFCATVGAAFHLILRQLGVPSCDGSDSAPASPLRDPWLPRAIASLESGFLALPRVVQTLLCCVAFSMTLLAIVAGPLVFTWIAVPSAWELARPSARRIIVLCTVLGCLLASLRMVLRECDAERTAHVITNVLTRILVASVGVLDWFWNKSPLWLRVQVAWATALGFLTTFELRRIGQRDLTGQVVIFERVEDLFPWELLGVLLCAALLASVSFRIARRYLPVWGAVTWTILALLGHALLFIPVAFVTSLWVDFATGAASWP
jgi:hypothetical protein